MKKRAMAYAALAAIGLSAASCSVKEDRSGCPCLLSVDLRSADITHPGVTHPDITVTVDAGGAPAVETVAVQDYLSYPFWERGVPRRTVTVSARSTVRGMDTEWPYATVGTGSQCDSLYAHASRVDCSGEEAHETAVLHKQFATLYIDMTGYGASRYPYGITVRGESDGISLETLSPHDGEFRFSPAAQGARGTRFICRIPRQGGRLLMDLTRDGTVMDTVDIGAEITRAGYSWHREDLDDIMLTVDHGTLAVSVSVLPWDRMELDDGEGWTI